MNGRIKVIFHPVVLAEDMPKLIDSQDIDPDELVARTEKAIQEIMEDKGCPQEGMDPPFEGWYRKKYFSHPPKRKERPDLRIIYQWSEDHETLKILSIGRRLQGSVDDIYEVATGRSWIVGATFR